MPVLTEQYSEPTPFDLNAFSGGINTSAPPREIEDTEVVAMENFELDRGDNVMVRAGVLADATKYLNRITSIFKYQNDTALVGILYTTGTTLKSRTLGGTITDITGSTTLPSDAFWQWKQLGNIAVGVNKATTGTNPVKVTGSAPGTAAALGGSPPRAKFIALWNNRLWLVRADQPNTVQCSGLGNAENWTTDGGTILNNGAIFDRDIGDGDQITGIHATKERLFVFKRNSIHVAVMVGTPNTDLNNIFWTTYTDKLGCIAANTIRTVGNDVVFLSEYGVASLAAAEVVANFRESMLSRKIKEISSVLKNTEEISAFVFDDVTQYWLSIPAAASPTGKNITYVMDYRRLFEGIVRWTTFNGYAFGTAFEKVVGNRVQYFIGCHDPDLVTNKFFIGVYEPLEEPRLFNDSGKAYRKYIKTKSFDFNRPKYRKEFVEWGLGLKVVSNDCSVSVGYYLDESPVQADFRVFTFVLTSESSLFDDATFDDGFLFDESSIPKYSFIRKGFRYVDQGMKGRTVSFDFLNDQLDEGFEIHSLSIDYHLISSDRTENVTE